MSTDWNKQSEGLDADHPWVELYKRTLARTDEELFDSLNDSDQLDGYCIVQADSMRTELERLKKNGIPEATASEIVLSENLPRAEEDLVEDWELEGAAEDEAAELGDWLG